MATNIFHKYDYHTWVATMTTNTILPHDAINNAGEIEIMKVRQWVDHLVRLDRSTRFKIHSKQIVP